MKRSTNKEKQKNRFTHLKYGKRGAFLSIVDANYNSVFLRAGSTLFTRLVRSVARIERGCVHCRRSIRRPPIEASQWSIVE